MSLYGTIEFYGEQVERNRTLKDPYHIAIQVQRLEPVRRELPPNTQLGYVSDIKPDSATILTVQFAVAPLLLVGNAPHEWVLGNFSKPQDYVEFGRAQGLTLVKQFANGVVLYRQSHR
ncbi:MAG: hypothetical protein JWO48_338, partial [Bryobacterales bacterium]|nr:hypothetical protein [Bryobacterales bacterium]